LEESGRGLIKVQTDICQNIQCPGRHSNREYQEYKSRALPLHQSARKNLVTNAKLKAPHDAFSPTSDTVPSNAAATRHSNSPAGPKSCEQLVGCVTQISNQPSTVCRRAEVAPQGTAKTCMMGRVTFPILRLHIQNVNGLHLNSDYSM
jgi:hypothetical protein